MTAIHTALSESPKADVVRFALDKVDQCHTLKRENAYLRICLRRMADAVLALIEGMIK